MDRPVFLAHPLSDYQVTDADLRLWRTALDGRSDLELHAYAVNHLLHPPNALGSPPTYGREQAVHPD